LECSDKVKVRNGRMKNVIWFEDGCFFFLNEDTLIRSSSLSDDDKVGWNWFIHEVEL
jgi:hypothetical protein